MTRTDCFGLRRDSVTSVGLMGRTLPFTSHNIGVKTFRQALSLDEHRSRFRHQPWAGTPQGSPAPDAASADHGEGDGHAPSYIERNYPWGGTDCKEVWFAGSHSGMWSPTHPKYSFPLTSVLLGS